MAVTIGPALSDNAVAIVQAIMEAHPRAARDGQPILQMWTGRKPETDMISRTGDFIRDHVARLDREKRGLAQRVLREMQGIRHLGGG